MFHVEVNLIYICYLVNLVFLMRPSGDQPDVPCGPRGEKFVPGQRIEANITKHHKTIMWCQPLVDMPSNPYRLTSSVLGPSVLLCYALCHIWTIIVLLLI